MKMDNMKFAMNKTSKLKSTMFPSKNKGKCGEEKEEEDSLSESKKLNVNEAYKEVFRTKSYMDMWSKVHFHMKDPILDDKFPPSSSSSQSSSSLDHSSTSIHPNYMHLVDRLLEPCQEIVNNVIKSSNVQTLLIDYFDASLEACNICGSLLQGIYDTRSNYRLIKKVVILSGGEREGGGGGGGVIHVSDYMNEQSQDKVIQDLDSFTRLKNPFSSIINGNNVDFSNIHIKYVNLLQNLISKRRKTKRKEKLTRYYKKAIRYGFMITHTTLTSTTTIHNMMGCLGFLSLVVALPIELEVINKVNDEMNTNNSTTSFYESVASQLDVAARGVFILINDLDTIERLAIRLNDEVEHTKAISQICVKNKTCQQVVKEALRDLHLDDVFNEQLKELEEHINLCLLTINRSRKSLIQEIISLPEV